MKKITLSIVTIVCCGMLTSCGMGMNGAADNSGNAGNGSILGAILTGGQAGNAGAANTGSVLGNIISIFAGDVLTNQNTLVGTWSYTQPYPYQRCTQSPFTCHRPSGIRQTHGGG